MPGCVRDCGKIEESNLMRHIVKSHWFWFCAALGLISVFDFADHATRNETYFRDVWFRWLLFTICSTLAVYGWLYTLNVLTLG